MSHMIGDEGKMGFTRGWTVIVLVFVLILSSACSAAPQAGSTTQTGAPAGEQEKSPIVIAGVLNITGGQAAIGDAQLDGLQMAIDQINQDGGIDGHQLKLVTADAADSPTTALNAFNKVVSEGARVVMGPIYGGQMEALLEPAATAQVPIFTGSGTATITEHGNPWVYRWIPSDALTKKAWVHFAKDYLKVDTVGLLHVTAAYGQSAANYTMSAAEELGVNVVGPETYAPTDKDMTIQLRKLKDGGAEVILVQGFAPDQALILQQAHQMQLEVPIVFSMSTLAAGAFKLEKPEEIANQYAEAGSVPQFDEDAETATWRSTFRERFDSEPDHISLGQYNAMLLFAEALKEAGVDASGESLTAAIKKVEVTTLGLPLKADADGNLAHSVLFVQFDDAKHGNVVHEYKE